MTASFVERFKEKHENKICVYFQFYNPKLSQEKRFMLYTTLQGYVQSALRRKQLITSLVERFK